MISFKQRMISFYNRHIYYNNWKNNIIDAYYKYVYGIVIGDFSSSLRPSLGKGEFVSVYRKGSFIDIVDETKPEFIRLIPCQYNHGIMVEFWKEGSLFSRGHIDLNKFKEIFGMGRYDEMCSRYEDQHGEVY